MLYSNRFILASLLVFFTVLCYGQLDYTTTSFGSPVDFPIILSANYGEIRDDHFHSGIDIKTQGASGKAIHTVADGYISRVSVSPGGFGKAIYITHPDGFTTVYAHLSRFFKDIDEYVRENQYREKSFQINLFLRPDEFRVARGDTIGYSGNTGSSSGPHLHFEVRDSRNEHPLNPLLFNFEIPDTIQPTIYSLLFYPLSPESHVEFRKEKKRFVVMGSNGNYALRNETPVNVGGYIGLGIETNDFLNLSGNRCGIYSIEVKADQVPVYLMELSEFSFEETRYINSHIDFEERIGNKRNIHQTFIDPNNRLSIYKRVVNRGILKFQDNETHEITIIIKDSYKNESRLNLFVHADWDPGKNYSSTDKTYSRIMPYDITNTYEHNGFKIVIPPNALYDILYFSYAKSPGLPFSYSEIHHVHNRLTPVHKAFTMRIQPDDFPEGLEDKLIIASLDENRELKPVGGEFIEGAMEVQVRDFGKFVIVADTVPPDIVPVSPVENRNLSGTYHLKFRIEDDFSGIRSYNGFIDDQWVLFEYDPKINMLSYAFDPSRLDKGKVHELVLTVIDNRENISVYSCNFIW